MKQLFKELDYESIMEKAKTKAERLFGYSVFILFWAMIAYPDIENYFVSNIVGILFAIDCAIELAFIVFGYRKAMNFYHKHPIFEDFICYIIYAATITIQIPLLKMLLEIPNNPDIVIKAFLIWFGVIVGLGVVKKFARDFAPKNYTDKPHIASPIQMKSQDDSDLTNLISVQISVEKTEKKA